MLALLINVKDGSGNTVDINNDTGFNDAYTYAGYRYDPESGLYSLNARYYAAGIGRFLTKDSIVINKVPKTLNLYAFVGGDPVNAYDPSGLIMEGNLDEGGAGYYSTTKQKNNSNIGDSAASVVESTTYSAGEQLAKVAPPIVSHIAYNVTRSGAKQIIVKSAIGLAKVSEFFKVLGVVGTAFSLHDDLYGGYSLSSKIGRTSLDLVTAVGLVIITSEFVTAAAPVIVISLLHQV